MTKANGVSIFVLILGVLVGLLASGFCLSVWYSVHVVARGFGYPEYIPIVSILNVAFVFGLAILLVRRNLAFMGMIVAVTLLSAGLSGIDYTNTFSGLMAGVSIFLAMPLLLAIPSIYLIQRYQQGPSAS